MRSSALLAEALATLQEIGHNHDADEPTRRHIEFAAAHLRAASTANAGQRATTPEETHKAVCAFFKLEALAKARTIPALA